LYYHRFGQLEWLLTLLEEEIRILESYKLGCHLSFSVLPKAASKLIAQSFARKVRTVKYSFSQLKG
jgi:uncharacterized protein YejL (UPF0352 family)